MDNISMMPDFTDSFFESEESRKIESVLDEMELKIIEQALSLCEKETLSSDELESLSALYSSVNQISFRCQNKERSKNQEKNRNELKDKFAELLSSIYTI